MKNLSVEELELVAGGRRYWDSTDGPWDNDETGRLFWNYLNSLSYASPDVYQGGPNDGQAAAPPGPNWQQYDPNVGLYWHYDSNNKFVLDGFVPAVGATSVTYSSMFPSLNYQPFASIGGGAYGVVGGIFYSDSTGLGIYLGAGTPGTTATLGFATEATNYLTGWTGHVQAIPILGLGHNPSSAAYTIGIPGTPGASLTYGISMEQIWDKVVNVGITFSTGTYDMIGRPYDPPPPPPPDGGSGGGGGGGGGGGFNNEVER